MTDETREKLIVLREALLEAPAEMTPAMVVGFINNMLADNAERVVPYNGCPNPDDEGGG